MAPKRHRHIAVAAKHKPREIRVLFIAEAPPNAYDRHFYFAESKRDDWLWIALMKGLFGAEFKDTKSERLRKPYWLARFCDSGYFLIDAVKEPISGESRKRVALIKSRIPAILSEIRARAPQRIVLVKSTVHKALFQPLKQAELDVINDKALPFPASGNQRRFHVEFTKLAISAKTRRTKIAEVERHLREARIVGMEPILGGTGYWGRAEGEFANAIAREQDSAKRARMNRRYDELAADLTDRSREERERVLLGELKKWKDA